MAATCVSMETSRTSFLCWARIRASASSGVDDSQSSALARCFRYRRRWWRRRPWSSSLAVDGESSASDGLRSTTGSLDRRGSFGRCFAKKTAALLVALASGGGVLASGVGALARFTAGGGVAFCSKRPPEGERDNVIVGEIESSDMPRKGRSAVSDAAAKNVVFEAPVVTWVSTISRAAGSATSSIVSASEVKTSDHAVGLASDASTSAGNSACVNARSLTGTSSSSSSAMTSSATSCPSSSATSSSSSSSVGSSSSSSMVGSDCRRFTGPRTSSSSSSSASSSSSSPKK
mmetsp:Transcript_18452/g.56637  ORF Transcript_18452/g.56637 Transcript_18452/m.56637 type:complete len:290 (+) Transcript_18452:543-1412(+)